MCRCGTRAARLVGSTWIIEAIARMWVAPTFSRLCAAMELDLPRPNVGAAQPCEAIRDCLWRKRTDIWPILALSGKVGFGQKSVLPE
jgi:hypothetical protein